MPVSDQRFEQLALEDPDGKWELYCGQLRRKPGMTYAHNRIGFWLAVQIANQIDHRRFDVRSDAGYVRRPAQSCFIPDVIVIPLELAESLREGRALETYTAPLPLVVEVWSRSTGGFDVETKLREYQRRGDLEIWLLHPYDHTLPASRRQPDGTYVETQYTGGTIQPVALPGVTVDRDALFD